MLFVVDQLLHDGVDAPVAHDDVRDCVIAPVCPVGQLMVCVCAASGVQDGAAGAEIVHVVYVYDPESVPLVHVRICDWHVCPAATVVA